MLHIDLETLSRRTALDVRHLRYCVENDLVPSRTWLTSDGTGDELSLPAVVDQVLLATAAALLSSGYSPAYATLAMNVWVTMRLGRRSSLNLPEIADAIMGNSRAIAQLADGRFVRWKVADFTSEWTMFSPVRKVIPDYVPSVILAVDIGLIRDRVRGQYHL